MLSFLAYVAVFHFIKQQVGFILLYDKTTENINSLKFISKKIDTLLTWIITGFPFLYWMMNYESISLNWFIPWEYIFISRLVPQTELIWIIYIISILIYIIFQILLIFRWVKVNPIKYLYILWTAYIWFNGMVVYNSIIVFGFWNILLHGLNYYGIIIGSTYQNRNYGKLIQTMKNFWIVFLSITIISSLLLLGYIEEFFWDQFVWREKTIIFSDFFYNIWYDQTILTIIVSILWSIQLTHYILDRYIWRWDFWDIN
jgi:hypothetical protein